MSNVSSSNGLGKYPKLRFKGFFEPWSVMKGKTSVAASKTGPNFINTSP